jgi:cysteine desulfurase
MRPGTENVASLVGFGVACEVAAKELDAAAARSLALRGRLWGLLREAIPGVALNGHPIERLPNTLSVRFPRVSGNALLAAAPDVAASTGSACHAGVEAAPGAIVAMGVPASEAIGTVRLTTGRHNSEADIVRAADALIAAWRSLVTAGD